MVIKISSEYLKPNLIYDLEKTHMSNVASNRILAHNEIRKSMIHGVVHFLKEQYSGMLEMRSFYMIYIAQDTRGRCMFVETIFQNS